MSNEYGNFCKRFLLMLNEKKMRFLFLACAANFRALLSYKSYEMLLDMIK